MSARASLLGLGYFCNARQAIKVTAATLISHAHPVLLTNNYNLLRCYEPHLAVKFKLKRIKAIKQVFCKLAWLAAMELNWLVLDSVVSIRTVDQNESVYSENLQVVRSLANMRHPQ